MSYAVIDTETSGLFDFSKPADADGQPRLAELAIYLLAPDLSVQSIRRHLIFPDGWEMHPEATAKNGLTTDYLRRHGEPVAAALHDYCTVISAGYVIASFNSQFDTKVMRGELRRANMPDLFEYTPNVCLMRAATPICKLPSKRGTGFKFPKLEEACAHFGIAMEQAHTAEHDASAAVEILRALHNLGALPQASVHYAKDRP